MRDFKRLKVWEASHQLALSAYGATSGFPREEAFGLTSQIRRAAASIPANIAEGCGRNGNAELVRFLHIALGSASELEYHLLLAHDLKLLKPEEYSNLGTRVVETKKMLASFINRLKADC